MKTLFIAWWLAVGCHAAQVTNTVSLGGVPLATQCDQAWTNQDVVLRFTKTIGSEGYIEGLCSFGVQPAFVWLYPSRLLLDLSKLEGVIARIEVVVTDQCGAGCTRLFAYRGSDKIAEVANAASGVGVLALAFDTLHPDACAISSLEAKVHRVRVVMEPSPPPEIRITGSVGSIVLSWDSGAAAYVLEWTADLSGVSGWTSQTNGVELDGSVFVYRPVPGAESRFFRLHRYGD